MNVYNNSFTRRAAGVLLLLLTCAALLPFLGLSDFNTKGEPREAVVAYTMLTQDNWLLPTNNGGEIPYKPPFFHWCVAAVSFITGGLVNEYTSRLPSAVALIAMTMTVFAFFSRRRGTAVGVLTALVTFTAFEIYRAGMNCRVDMVLTALMVGATISLYKWGMEGMRRFPWQAILLMSAAMLTKGPVGIILPCLATGIFLLLRGVPFFKAFCWLCLWGVLSLILPLCWYVAAYHQRGDAFLDLVIEENFGRMTGTMAYESHLNPWYYNLVTLVAGFVPWTIAALTALFIIPRPARSKAGRSLRTLWSGLREWIRTAHPCSLFCAVTAITIFLFYCIPASKRSVYLMPMYPFVAYFIAEMLLLMTRRRPGVVKGFGDFIAILGCLLLVAFALVKCGVIPDSVMGHGKHAAQNVAILDSLRKAGGFRTWFWGLAAPVCAAIWWRYLRQRVRGAEIPLMAAVLTVSVYMSMSGAYQPAVLQPKSLKSMARAIQHKFPPTRGAAYEFISGAEKAKGNPLHYFELDFYMYDVIRNFLREKPMEGYLLIEDKDMDEYGDSFRSRNYVFTKVYTPAPSLPRHTPGLYYFYDSVRKAEADSIKAEEERCEELIRQYRELRRIPMPKNRPR